MSGSTGDGSVGVGIIGAGLQGQRRASALRGLGTSRLAIVADSDAIRAQTLAQSDGADHTTRWQDVIERPDIDVVIISTPPHIHAEVAIAAARAGKHVLCEKPLARTVEEASAMVAAAAASGTRLSCGFNLRYHPAVQAVRRWVDEGVIGDITFVRCRYGIGGRAGYETDWRVQPATSGGGQLMDQGAHAIDLCRWFLGDVADVTAVVDTAYWPIAPVEDNAFVLLRGSSQRIASLHVSWTQWTPLFSLEVFGTDGFATAEGLGGAYGTERATIGRRDFTAPFAETTTEFRGGDRSWTAEWLELLSSIAENRPPLASGADGLEVLRVADAAYRSAQSGVRTRLN